jgi:colicin import membrane protein
MDALRRRLSECWNPPPGVDINSNLYVVLHVQFKPDGFLATEPAVVEDLASSLGPALAESGKRALLSCQPFTMLKREHYDLWKDISVKFNPHDLLGG